MLVAVAVAVLVDVNVGVIAGVFVAVFVAVDVAVAVAVEVGVDVEVEVGTGVPVEVDVGVEVFVPVGAGPQPSVVMCNAHPPLIEPKSVPSSSTTYSDHVPFGELPLKIERAEPPNGAGAGAAHASPPEPV